MDSKKLKVIPNTIDELCKLSADEIMILMQEIEDDHFLESLVALYGSDPGWGMDENDIIAAENQLLNDAFEGPYSFINWKNMDFIADPIGKQLPDSVDKALRAFLDINWDFRSAFGQLNASILSVRKADTYNNMEVSSAEISKSNGVDTRCLIDGYQNLLENSPYDMAA